MKARLIYFLTLVFILTCIPVTADEYRSESTSRQKSVRKYRKSVKKKKRKSRKRIRSRKRYAKAKVRRPAARKKAPRLAKGRPRVKRPRAMAPRTVTARKAAPRIKQTSEPKANPPVATREVPVKQPTVAAKQPVAPPKQPVAKPDPRLASVWRGSVSRSIAQTTSGRTAPVEHFASLGTLMRSLPEDGEIRVRYGLYPDTKKYIPQERIDPERRNIRVPCWLYAVRYDTVGKASERDIELLVGTSNDTSSARFMIAALPGLIPNTPDALLFEQARNQLLALLGDYEITTSFRRMNPKQVTVEGSLFFNAAHTISAIDDPSGKALAPSTVWELHPVTSVMAGVVMN